MAVLSVCAACDPDGEATAVVAFPSSSPLSSKESANSGALETRFSIAVRSALAWVAAGFTVPVAPQPSRHRIVNNGSATERLRCNVMGTLLEMVESLCRGYAQAGTRVEALNLCTPHAMVAAHVGSARIVLSVSELLN